VIAYDSRPMSLRSASLVLLLAACATPKDSASAGSPKAAPKDSTAHVVPLAQLPEAQKRVLTAYARGGDEWEREREDVLADPALTSFLVDNLIVEMVRAHAGLTGAEPARSRRAFDRAVNELVRVGEPSLPQLVGLLEVSDGIVSALASYTLRQLGKPAALAVEPLLDSPNTETRRRAAAVLEKLPHTADNEPELRKRLVRLALSDPEWLVRAEAAQTLGSRGHNDRVSEPWRKALEECLFDSDPAVADAAARGLTTLGDARAIPALINSLERTAQAGNLRVFKATQTALRALSAGQVQPDVAAWRKWWDEHRVEIEKGRVPGRQ